MKPATFRELAAVEAKVIRALRGLSPEDQVRVLESVEREIQEPEPVKPCEGIISSGNSVGLQCGIYAGHTGEHRS